MSNSELKAYLSALKGGVSKRGGIPSIQKVAKMGNALITTNLDVYYMCALDPHMVDGLYEPYALDLLAMGNSDIEPITEWTLDDYPELDVKGWGEWHTLTSADIDHIIEAGACVSKDDTRPALGQVALTDRLIAGTDGYILTAHLQSQDLDFGDTTVYLDRQVVATLKKLRKYGTWRVRVSEDGHNVCLSNDTFVIVGKIVDQPYPDIRRLLNAGSEFTHSVELDFATLSVMAGKDNTLDIDLTTGETKLNGQTTGVVAKIRPRQETRLIANGRTVAMPVKAEDGHLGVAMAFLKRLTKEKSITLLTSDNTSAMIEVM